MNIKELRLTINEEEVHLKELLEETAEMERRVVNVLSNLDEMKIELAGRT
jgi:predicted RNA-binding protein